MAVENDAKQQSGKSMQMDINFLQLHRKSMCLNLIVAVIGHVV